MDNKEKKERKNKVKKSGGENSNLGNEDKSKEALLSELKKELEECRKKENEYLSGWQRERADFLNYKRKEAENLKLYKDSIESNLLVGIIDIFDNFDRAARNVPEEIKGSDWEDGFLRIKDQFINFLKKNGIEEIGREGEEFNPELHEAVGQVDGLAEKSGIIVEVLGKGYLKDGKIIRPAKVKVSK